MEAHLEAHDLWEAMDEDYEVPLLPANPTMAQIKNHKEQKSRKSKNFLKKEYEGDERIKGMKILNLIREFELQKINDSETVKEYSDRLLGIANKVRLLGSKFPDSILVQKILVTVPKRFEATISLLENTKDVSKISLAELMNALKAQEQRRLMRSEGSIEEIGHHQRICKSNIQEKIVTQVNLQQKNVAQVSDEEQEEQLFVASCFAICQSSEKWLIDNGRINHMTFDHDLFEELDTSVASKVKIGNGEYIAFKEKGTMAIESTSVFGCLFFVYVPQIKRDKLDRRAEAGIFVGYSTISKAYRIFQPNTKKILISKDMHFMENDEWDWEGKQSALVPDQVPKLQLKEDELVDDIPDRDTIRLLLAIATHKGWKVYQVDVKSAFLNGFLEDEIFVQQPERFVVKGQEDDVYLLKKALYGLKQAPRAWYSLINEHLMIQLGFRKSLSEATLYIKGDEINFVVVSLYVDDLLVTGNNEELVKNSEKI
ncbi:uncharacterized protein LOC120265069 [Dioscorea cayenensis subsp. rotundata]|uniref:Uncharacterized protein LOC120265069 n=1 Tax=Dioscorea cayennensis subsp. rotundata TaxID=55577 RepID=A0AB40BN96_DIOCR|nr:uncharacterized protein LOC120265069 [Dioscorea cayenensis subsp. rotundata]